MQHRDEVATVAEADLRSVLWELEGPDRHRLTLRARLADEPPGFRQVGAVVGAVGPVAVDARGQELACNLPGVDLGEAVAVHGEVERSPDADVVERCEPRVQPEPEDRELRFWVELARVACLERGCEFGGPSLVE